MPRPAAAAARVDRDHLVALADDLASVGTAKSGVPMKTTRSATGPHPAGPEGACGHSALALRRLLEFLDHPVALELREAIDEQDAVEMVDLVLDAGGEQPVRLAARRPRPSRVR